jgi:hypothetical protein
MSPVALEPLRDGDLRARDFVAAGRLEGFLRLAVEDFFLVVFFLAMMCSFARFGHHTRKPNAPRWIDARVILRDLRAARYRAAVADFRNRFDHIRRPGLVNEHHLPVAHIMPLVEFPTRSLEHA